MWDKMKCDLKSQIERHFRMQRDIMTGRKFAHDATVRSSRNQNLAQRQQFAHG
jgi:hypothetical protein